MTGDLVSLCMSHGIEPGYRGFDGHEHLVPEETLAELARIFGLTAAADAPPGGITDALAERGGRRSFVPPSLRGARVWGLTCQVPSLTSARNLGMGDFADLAALARISADAGADFLGTNPLHAMFWADPGRISPFSPSNRRLLNPLYIAPDWIDGFDGLAPDERAEVERLRASRLIDAPGVAALKDRILRRLFRARPDRPEFARFVEQGGETLRAHALFEAISVAMVAEGHGAGWPTWPAAMRDRCSTEVREFAARNREEIQYHLWLQWQADRQLGRVQAQAIAAGMRVGLYLDIAVGAVPDGSATWSDPQLTVPELKIGAPPDDFSLSGQDWGLAPLSPVTLTARDGEPLAEVMSAVMRHAGAVRIDHAMSLARLWLIPRDRPALEGAYVRYPLSSLLARLAEASQAARAVVVGEDLGVVPEGFRSLMARRALHSYKVWFFERGRRGVPAVRRWPITALACLGTHDMPTLEGWMTETDLDMRERIGLLPPDMAARARHERARDREKIRQRLGAGTGTEDTRLEIHRHMAAAPCRMAALQIEDALGMIEQINVPGTVDEYPNWRHRLPAPLDALPDHPGFRAHVRVMQAERPR